MKRFRIAVLLGGLLLALSLIALPTAQAAQALPPYAWYAVVHNPQTDTLHWVSPLGEVASLARPQLPNEAPGAAARIAISPNGRYALIVATRLDNTEGIGIYDFQAGAFTASHVAQPGEQVELAVYDEGRRFNLTSTRVAVGLFSGNLQQPISWRIIVFDLATGAALSQLTNADAPAVEAAGLFPRVVYFDVDEGLAQEHVHFIMQPLTGDAPMYPAFDWNIDAGLTVSASPYTHKGDIDLVTGEQVYAALDPNFGAMPYDGLLPNNNAILRGFPGNTVSTIWADGTRYNSQARWANNRQWVLYFSDDGADNRHWNVILADGTPQDNTRIPLGYGLIDAQGTPDGYLALTETNTLYHAMMLPPAPYVDLHGTQIFAANSASPVQIVYVTPPSIQFTLTSVGGGQPAVDGPDDLAAQPTATVPPLQAVCSGAPAPRLTVGGQAQVTIINGTPLRVRATPGGDIVTTLPEGTVVNVIGGPECQDVYTWWQIQRDDVIGWSAEGDLENYFLEPYTESPGGIVAVPVNPTATPGQPLQVAPPVQPTATPPLVVAVPVNPTPTPPLQVAPPVVSTDGDCSLAPQQFLSVGMSFQTDTTGTLAMRDNPADAFPVNQIQDGIFGNVIGGPVCHGGYRLFRVSVLQNGQTLTGWLSEGTQQQRFLIP